jgi:hypothetical protein
MATAIFFIDCCQYPVDQVLLHISLKSTYHAAPVVSHNKTKCKKNETREQNYFLSIIPMQVYNTSLRCRMGIRPPCGGQGARHRHFLR